MAEVSVRTAGTNETVSFESFPKNAAGVRRMTYTEFLDNSPMTRFLWFVWLGCIVAQILDGFDFQATSFALPLITKEFHISPTQAGALGSLTNFGLLLGALISGPVSDRFGRRPIFQWALFTYAFGTFLSAIAPNYTFLLLARFVAGLGIAGEFPVVATLLAEYAPKRLRHVFVGSYAIGYSFGWFVCAIVATIVVPRFGWRALYFLGVAPAFLIIYVQRYIPESVRFLLMKGRVQEAGELTRKIADKGGFADLELVPPEAVQEKARKSLLQQYSALRFVGVAIAVLALFQIANNIQVVGFGTWLPSIFVRAGFTLTKSFKFTMIVLAVTPLGQIFGIWLQDKMPRKWAMLFLAGLSAVCFFGFGLAFEYKYPIAVIVACNVGYQFFSGGVSPIVVTLGTEIFPTRVRSLAWGLVSACARIGSICGPFILGFFLTLGTEIHQIIYYFTLPLLLAAIVVVIFIKVDMRQKTLEEVREA
jgi:putative MFS transporter